MNLELIHDIYTEPNFIKTIVPFSDLRKSMDNLLRSRDYHSQCTLEFYLILETLDLSKDSFTTRPLIKEMFNCALLNQRTSEYAIICSQFDLGLIGIQMASTEKIYQLYIILHSTLNYVCKIYDPALPDEPVTFSRSSAPYVLANACQSKIEKLFHMLSDPTIPKKADKDGLNARLSLCNQNLNKMYVILK